MRRIRKTLARVPKDAIQAAQAARQECEACHDSGRPLPGFRRELLEPFRKALLAAQHNNCAYCETPLILRTATDIEHFRPKGGWRQSKSGKLNKPGYYWLAYAFENLLLVCGDCNRICKGNYFPLADPDQRALTHHHDLSLEQPLLIDPYKDNPSKHLKYNRHVVVGLDEKGRTTEKMVGLNRKELKHDRLADLQRMKQIAKLVALGDAEAIKLLKARASKGEYSMMIRDNFFPKA